MKIEDIVVLLKRGQPLRGLPAFDVATLDKEDPWWLVPNPHGPFTAVSTSVEPLKNRGLELLVAADSLHPFQRCALEVTLAAHGHLPLSAMSEASRDGFLWLLLTMYSYQSLVSFAERIWGDTLPWALVEAMDKMPWVYWSTSDYPVIVTIEDPARFKAIFPKLSPMLAAQILSRGHWKEVIEGVALMDSYQGDLRPAHIACAERWLEMCGLDCVNYVCGGGRIVTFLGLARTGEVDPRYYNFIDTTGYAWSDLPFLTEAVQVFPLEEREKRALRWDHYVDVIFGRYAPTKKVIERQIEHMLGWKANAKGQLCESDAAKMFAAWGENALPALLKALDGTRAPFTPMLLEFLANLEAPASAPVFERYLAYKHTREPAAKGLARLGGDHVWPILEQAVVDKKKETRIGAAVALGFMPRTEAVVKFAAACLAKERNGEVRQLLEKVV